MCIPPSCLAQVKPDLEGLISSWKKLFASVHSNLNQLNESVVDAL